MAHPEVQPSLRDAMRGLAPPPWVETHGYHISSLRDDVGRRLEGAEGLSANLLFSGLAIARDLFKSLSRKRWLKKRSLPESPDRTGPTWRSCCWPRDTKCTALFGGPALSIRGAWIRFTTTLIRGAPGCFCTMAI